MSIDDAARDVVSASRILAMLEVLDAFGHVSRRSPEREDRFLISRSLAPSRVSIDDILELDFNGDEAGRSGQPLFLERYLHAEIYRTRPDVNAIVHSHSKAVLPFTISRTEQLAPVSHMCGFLHDLPRSFDLASEFGDDTDLLIRDSERGAALATQLGGSAVVLMRGHGFTAVGASIPQATFRAYYTIRNCEVQTIARQFGDFTSLGPGEAAACEAATNAQISRAWDLWLEGVKPPEEEKSKCKS